MLHSESDTELGRVSESEKLISLKNPMSGGFAEDKHKLAYICFLFLGVGALFPFNSFITAVDYYMVVYPGGSPEFFFSALYVCSNLVLIFPLAKFSQGFSFSARVYFSLACYVLIFIRKNKHSFISIFSITRGKKSCSCGRESDRTDIFLLVHFGNDSYFCMSRCNLPNSSLRSSGDISVRIHSIFPDRNIHCW